MSTCVTWLTWKQYHKLSPHQLKDLLTIQVHSSICWVHADYPCRWLWSVLYDDYPISWLLQPLTPLQYDCLNSWYIQIRNLGILMSHCASGFRSTWLKCGDHDIPTESFAQDISYSLTRVDAFPSGGIILKMVRLIVSEDVAKLLPELQVVVVTCQHVDNKSSNAKVSEYAEVYHFLDQW